MIGSAQELVGVINELRALLDVPAIERVHALGAWLDNTGTSTSIRTRLGTVRALAALEVASERPISTEDLGELFGMAPATAYKLIARGRSALNAARD